MTARRLTLALVAAGTACIGAALALGPTALSLGEVSAALFGAGPESARIVVVDIRLPRALAAYLVGASLGLAGASLQGLFRNPLAEPGTLGVSAVSALAASFTIYFGIAAFAPFAIAIAAVAGALAATTVLAAAAMRTRTLVTLLLIGLGLSSFAGALMALLMNLAPHPFTLADMISWMLGSVANRSFADLTIPAPFLAIGAALVLSQRHALAALTLGEEAAAGVGVDLVRVRAAIIIGAGLLAGASVAIAGAVGFVGVVAPHLVRPFVGHDPGRSLVPAALLGGAILTCADLAARLIPTAAELRLGVLAALVGAPVFVWIAVKRSDARD